MLVIKFNQDYQPFIRLFDESEVEQNYNAFGYLFKNESFKENLAEYKKERDEEIAYTFEDCTPTFSELKKAITVFQENYQYDSVSSPYTQNGRPEIFLEEDSEEFVTDISKYVDENGTPLGEEDFEVMEIFVTEWDGSNFKKTVIHSDYGDSQTEDLTDEWSDAFENCVIIGSTRGDTQNQTGWTEFYLDKKSGTVLIKNVSLWQGDSDTWEIVKDKEEIDIIFVKYASDEIEKFRPQIHTEYGNNIIVVEDRQTYYSYEERDFPNYSDRFTIVDLDSCKELGGWRGQNSGGEYYYHSEHGLISYSWSAWQGSWCGYEWSDKTLEDVGISLNTF